MTANVKEGKLIYLMKISRFFFVCLFNLASDQLLILGLLTRASNWHFILFIICFFPLMILVNLRAWISSDPVSFLLQTCH